MRRGRRAEPSAPTAKPQNRPNPKTGLWGHLPSPLIFDQRCPPRAGTSRTCPARRVKECWRRAGAGARPGPAGPVAWFGRTVATRAWLHPDQWPLLNIPSRQRGQAVVARRAARTCVVGAPVSRCANCQLRTSGPSQVVHETRICAQQFVRQWPLRARVAWPQLGALFFVGLFFLKR